MSRFKNEGPKALDNKTLRLFQKFSKDLLIRILIVKRRLYNRVIQSTVLVDSTSLKGFVTSLLCNTLRGGGRAHE